MIAQPLREEPTLREILQLTASIRNSDKSTVTGDLGETLFMKTLAPHWLVEKPSCCKEGDFRITDTITGLILCVEVKTAKKCKRDKYSFQLFKKDKHGQTDYEDSDLLVLFAIDNAGVPFSYVMPTAAVSAKKIEISSHPTDYKGKYAKWLQRGRSITPLKAYDIYQLI